MSLVPNCQFCQTTFLDSFQTSFSRLQAVRFHFLRHSSSNSSKKLNFYTTQNAISSDSTPEKYPQKKSNLVLKNKKNTCFLAGETQISSRWIEKWIQDYQPKLPNRPQALLDYRNGGGSISSEDDDMGSRNSTSSSSTGGSTMEKIVEKLKRFGYIGEANEKKEAKTRSNSESVPERGSVEDIFYVEEGLLPNSRGGFSKESPLGIESVFGGNGEVRFPWEKPLVKGDEGRNLGRRRSRTSLAELTLPESELRRLRHLAVRTKHKKKIGGGGVTQAIVDLIHEKWKTAEIVRLKCEGPPALNMKRMHEILERKTGGLVIWRSGTSVSLYRGVSYELPSKQQEKKQVQKTDFNSYMMPADENAKDRMEQNSVYDAQKVTKEAEQLPEVAYEHEIDKLLDGLGPRFMDWPGDDPLPVDADLLPGVVPGYKPPFRVLPYGVRATLGTKEATALRRLARVLPPHFAIGRSRQHQGLAMAMVKLWERSSIAKIALKRGVQLTTSERMAEDIKKMTGGTLLSRNKDFIVFYRGKDFLSRDVTEALLEREGLAKALQDEEEQARLRASSLVVPSVNTTVESGDAGTLSETLEADARWGKRLDDSHMDEVKRDVEIARHANLVRKLERKLAIGQSKLKKAERALEKVEAFLKPLEQAKDSGSITDEERFMFRKLGLRMKAFLLLGRRGVFDGTVENMHLHWKYRELVKIIVKAKNFDHVRNIALSLEAESGGILVSVDKVSKGFAIIVYRGKDYKRPPSLRPKNLLTKRKALARSIELQRREALCNHISTLQRSINSLRSELGQMESVKDKGEEKLYTRLDSAYSTEDEDSEGEDDDAYLMTYGSTNEGEDDVSIDASDSENEGDDGEVISNDRFETDFPYNDQSESWGTNHEPSNPSYAIMKPTS